MATKTNHRRLCTRIESREINFQWTIESFSSCNMLTGQAMQSQKFPKLDEDQLEWTLTIYPNGVCQDVKNNISIYLKCVSEENVIITVNFKLELLINQKVFKVEEIKKKEIKGKSNIWDFPKFFELDSLPSSYKQYNYSLIIRCCVQWQTGISDVSDVLVNPLDSLDTKAPDVQNVLLSDLKTLKDETNFSDVTLLANDGTKFSAHKCILATRSSVFAAMFSHDMKERQESIVKIEDINNDTLESMLEFIYTSKFDAKNSKIDEMFVAADKYALNDLKLLCEQKLTEELQVNNVIKYLLLADLHNAEVLKTKCIEVISNNLKCVLETEAMKNLSSVNLTLFYDTIRAVAAKK